MLKRVYVWEFPVRLTHWINVLSIASLSITGYYIGNPFIHAISTEQYIMGWMRFIHFVAAYLFTVSFLLRIYWSLAGNRYASWMVFFPFSKRRLMQIVESVKFYALISKKQSHMMGHSAIAGLTYLFIYLLFLVEIITGFALYSQSHYGMIRTLMGGWLLDIISVQTIRLYHHLITWVLIVFAIVHVYVAWFVDIHERNGIIGSIFGGYKFVTKDYE